MKLSVKYHVVALGMPRISPGVYHQLPTRFLRLSKLLLPTCRTLEQTSNELQWIQSELPTNQWLQACQRRNRKAPLQYILGSQPFGSIDIKCQPGVLIPRWETEEYTMKIVDKIRSIGNVKKVVDICTGSGCIPLLIAKECPQLKIEAYDVSEAAISLSKTNTKHNDISNNVQFSQGDVFDKDLLKPGKTYDLVISNPPYIPLQDYKSNEVEPSVRRFEPKLALVGNLEFYEALMQNVVIPSQCNAFVFELGYEEQYLYTSSLLDEESWNTKRYFDSAGKLRCVVGWKVGSAFEIFAQL